MSAAFPARYDGTCAAKCGERIHPGDLVRYDPRLVHDKCATHPTEPPAPVVCGVCWQLKPCRCDD